MKITRLSNQKYYQEEEIKITSAEVKLALLEYLGNCLPKFQTGWNFSFKSVSEIAVTCSRFTGFTCQNCQSARTTKICCAKNCNNLVCEKNYEIGKCCVCLIN